MKYNIKQITAQYLQEAQQYNEGNIADHLIINAQEQEDGYHFYLSEESINEFEQDKERHDELIEEVESWIRNTFNFDFEEYAYECM